MAEAGPSQTDLDERELVEAAQADPARFGQLYELHFHRVYAYVARRVGERSAAEDVTAETFREALAGLKDFEWRGAPFRAWLLRIASRAVADYWKREGREAGEAVEDEGRCEPEVERNTMLFQLVERLPEAQFRVIHMRFVEQKSIAEVARALDRSEGAVKQLQLRAIETLRQQMEGGNG